MLSILCRLDGEVQKQELLRASLRRANQQRELQVACTSRTLHEQVEERSTLLEQQKRQLAALYNSLHMLKVPLHCLMQCLCFASSLLLKGPMDKTHPAVPVTALT